MGGTWIFQRLVRSDDGTILPFVGMTLAVILGILALTYDIGRMSSNQGDLQSFADSVVLAAAGELDGRADSITRAQAAAAVMIADAARFGIEDDVLSGAGDYDLTFLTARPVGSNLAAYTTSDSKKARFVHVAVTPQTIEPGFAAAFSALSGHETLATEVAAEAAAGFSQVACDITPLMFCMPNADFRADENVGMVIKLRAGGGAGAAWGPGDFGFLDPSDGDVDEDGVCSGLNGSQLDRCLVAAIGNRLGCFDSNGVTTRPGQSVGNAESALNVIFDIYNSTMNSARNDPKYAPAPNVISGYRPANGKCLGNNAVVSTNSVALPVDDCFVSGTCSRFGNGTWTNGRQTYVQTNYGTNVSDPHPTAQTRYQYYLAEIAAAGGGASSTAILTGRQETGRPRCSNNRSADPARRVMVAAAIDCTANPIRGRTEDVPAREFVEIFMLRPIGLDGSADVWVEVIGSAGGSADGNESDALVRDVVRLAD
jgi:Putative Flp pilus-assembly TadE/G-like